MKSSGKVKIIYMKSMTEIAIIVTLRENSKLEINSKYLLTLFGNLLL